MSDKTKTYFKRGGIGRSSLLYTVAVVMILATTWVLHIFQVWLSRIEDGPVRAFSVGYLLPLALISFLGGRRLGAFSLALALLLSAYLLMPPTGFRVRNPADIASLLFLLLTGSLVIATVDTGQRNAVLRREAQGHARREALLAQIARMARGSALPGDIQSGAARAVARELEADRAYFIVYDFLLGVAQITDEWYRPGLPPLAGKYPDLQDTALLNVCRRGVPLVIPDISSESLPGAVQGALAAHQVRSLVYIPLETDGLVQAVFGVAMADSPRKWAAADVEFTEMVAAETRAAVEAGRLFLREQTISRALQEAILPPPCRDVPGLDVATDYRAALAEATIGGDFCDVFPLGGMDWALVVGDVSGKGLQAASQIGVARNMLRYVLYQQKDLGKDLAESVAELNGILTNHALLTGFATLFVAVYDAMASTLTYVSCGHEPALLRRATGLQEPLPPTGPVLGVIPGGKYLSASRTLSPGDTLFIYTDGASEAGPDRAHQLELDGLSDLLDRHTAHGKVTDAKTLVKALAADVRAHAGGVLHDDLCLLTAVRHISASPQHPAKPGDK